jgi:hypothetical protein
LTTSREPLLTELDGSKKSSAGLKGGFTPAIRTFEFERPMRFWEQKTHLLREKAAEVAELSSAVSAIE